MKLLDAWRRRQRIRTWGIEPINGVDITGENPAIGAVSDVQCQTRDSLFNDDWYLYGIIPPVKKETR